MSEYEKILKSSGISEVVDTTGALIKLKSYVENLEFKLDKAVEENAKLRECVELIAGMDSNTMFTTVAKARLKARKVLRELEGGE